MAVVSLGVVVAVAPEVWYRLAWPDAASQFGGGPVLDLVLFGVSVAPFALVALLRTILVLGRRAAVIATLLAGAIVVFGQIAGMDPNDPSSTAAIALVTAPLLACGVIGCLALVDSVTRAIFDSWRAWRDLRKES